MNNEKNFLELTGFIKLKTEPIGNERRIIKKNFFSVSISDIKILNVQELPGERKILRKRKFRCLTLIFNFSFNHKCNLVSITS